MTFEDFKQKLIRYRPVFFLENSISHRVRVVSKKILIFLMVIAFVLSSGIISSASSGMTSVFFLFLFFFLALVAIDAFYYSYYFADESEYFFELASIIFSGKGNDATSDFIKSQYGERILWRLGISSESIGELFKSRKLFNPKDSLQFDEKISPIESYFSALLASDQEFKNFLLAHGVTVKVLSDASKLVFGLEGKRMEGEQWWSPTRLGSIRGFGQDWSYGGAYTLSHWSSPIHYSVFQKQELHGEELRTLETVLSKSNGANALLLGDDGIGKMEVLEGLARKISKSDVLPVLIGKKILILDIVGIASSTKEKSAFERLLVQLLNDAVKAGNIILVIPDLSAFFLDAESLKINLETILSPFLASSSVQLVAISDLGGFHRFIEPNQGLTVHFEVINVKSGGVERILSILEDDILELESREGLIFTYPALFEAVTSAERYFVGSPLFDTAQDLLVDSASMARGSGRKMVLRDDILTLVKTKTGVPTGNIDNEEKEKLENLESHLHDRIVGQDEAVVSISDALRRARSGIGSPSRPIGSFLFLGPTGVGKTETTKALAEIFFGKSAKVLRIDMSEYNTPDALNRLIGAFDGDNPGVLSSMLRENPYGVLLLDEFEKTDKKVLDLFLQILDEGIFSDVLGRKVNARNLIIIATSNAGSQHIFDVMARGGKLLEEKDSIIENIIKEGIFKPELLNRFDGVILFHPLNASHLREVAKLMLSRLSWRLKDRGITLVVNDALLDFLVKKGSDIKFGARPLNRAIQDTVEKLVADKIISGVLKPGGEARFSSEELV